MIFVPGFKSNVLKYGTLFLECFFRAFNLPAWGSFVRFATVLAPLKCLLAQEHFTLVSLNLALSERHM
jgi:hypothetical protein